MKKIKLENLDLEVCYEKLENGLEVYLVPYQNKNNYFMTYATRFGSLNTAFVPISEKNMVKVPDGIAHFLEHKMFEQEDGIDPFTYYAKTGTGANASTSFDNTQYICYGTKHLSDNLLYLLDYVNAPYFTDENVEKEKGIIAQEIKMYEDIPEWVLEDELRASLYHVHPLRVDIAGTVDEINQIKKEDLYRCYNTYYRPSNMFLIVAGKMDPESLMEQIRANQQAVVEKKKVKVKEKTYDEPAEVFQKEKSLEMNVKVPKVGYGIKFDRSKLPIKDDHLLDVYLNMFTTLVFGMTSKFREDARNMQLMTSFYTEWERAGQYKDLLIMAEAKNPEKFLKRVKQELEQFAITEEDIERIKKVWIASEVQMVDVVETTVNNLYDDILHYQHIIANKVSLIRSLNKKDLDLLLAKLDFSNASIVTIYPNSQEEA